MQDFEQKSFGKVDFVCFYSQSVTSVCRKSSILIPPVPMMYECKGLKAFTDLVVEHHKEERNVNYYAKLLGYDPRYFSKIFRAFNEGTSPLEWIQNYVTNQAKRMISEHPEQSIKEVSIQLGFPTTANFCRYFKTATNMTPQQYKDSIVTPG